MPRPVADLIADYIPAAQCLKGNKVLLLQPFQYGQRLALEPGTEPLGQLLEGADPFARVDGIANAPVLHQKADELPVDPAAWVVHHLFNL